MKSFGSYQVIEELAHRRGTVIYKAQDGGSDAIIKVFHLAHFADGNPKKVEELSKWFFRTVEMQKEMADKSSHIVPVLSHGIQGEAAWQASPVYQGSIQKLLGAQLNITRANLQLIVESVLQAALDLKQHYGRSHGNLKPGNVLFHGDPKTTMTGVAVCDPAPGDGAQSIKFEVADLRAIGQLIYLLLNPSETRDPSTWRLSAAQPPPAWSRLFGGQTRAWIQLCTRLLDPDLTTESCTLEKLQAEVLQLKPAASAKRPLVLAGTAVAVVALAAGAFIFLKPAAPKPVHMSSPATPAPSTSIAANTATEKTSNESKAEPATSRVADESRIAEQRDAEARIKAEQEAKRAAEARQLAERQAAEPKRAPQGNPATTQENKAQTTVAKFSTQEAVANQPASASLPPAISRSAKPQQPTPNKPWVNSLGMRFAPLSDQNEFLVSTWETRRKDFEEFTQSARNTTNPSWKKTTFQQSGLHPVVNVTAKDAQAFCEWLTGVEREKGMLSAGQFYRLPSQVEWITFAAKPSGTPGYAWGNVWPPPSGIGNYGATYSYDRFDFTAPVGQFRPNAAGLYDLAGNVWEICDDVEGSAWSALGGSWLTVTPEQLGLSANVALSATDKREDIGFRVVLDFGR